MTDKKNETVGCLFIVGMFVVFCWVCGTDDLDKKTNANTETSTQAIDNNLKLLFESENEFKEAYNEFCDKKEYPFHINKIKRLNGDVQNSFQIELSDWISLLGTVDKNNGGVNGLTLICMPNGSTANNANILLAMLVLISVVDPSIPPENRADVLKSLGMFDKNVDYSNMNTETSKNGIKYSIVSGKGMGIWLCIEKAKTN
jgi:hypothetical protein